MTRLRVAVDYQSAAGRKTGIGVFAANLFGAMRSLSPDMDFLMYEQGGRDLNTPRRILWESVTIPSRLRRDRPDLVYTPGFAPPMFAPCPRVATVHDLIGVLFPGNQRGFSKIYWTAWLPAAMRRARLLAASSESTRRDVLRLLRIDEKKVRVVPLSVDPCFKKLASRDTIDAVLSRRGLSRRRYFIAVGSLEPRKNLLRLLQAYALLAERADPGFDLAIAGKPAGAERELAAFVAGKPWQRNVHFLGYTSDEELVALYNGALGYAAVSLYEGFGLPALEAMSCGRSGVVSERTSLPEVVGDTAILVDPEKPAAIAEALTAYAETSALREDLERAAHERSAQFSPQRMAKSMIELFQEAAG